MLKEVTVVKFEDGARITLGDGYTNVVVTLTREQADSLYEQMSTQWAPQEHAALTVGLAKLDAILAKAEKVGRRARAKR